MRGQLTFDLPDDGAQPAVAFLTIAEAAAQCAAASARSAARSTAVRCAPAASPPWRGKRGGYRIRPADLETWMYGDGA